MVVCRHKTTQTIQLYEIKQNQYVVHAYTNKIAIFQFAILKRDTSKHRMQAQTNKIWFVKTQREGNEILIDCNTHAPTLRQHTHILLDRSTQTSLFYFKLQCRCELPAESQLFCHISPTHLRVSSKLNWNTRRLPTTWQTHTLNLAHKAEVWTCDISDQEGRRATERGGE